MVERGRSSRKGTGCPLVGVAAVHELACEEQAEFRYRSKMSGVAGRSSPG